MLHLSMQGDMIPTELKHTTTKRNGDTMKKNTYEDNRITRNNNASDKNTPHKKKATPKQIAAITGLVPLLLLYAVTLITAFIDTAQTRKLFELCAFATFVLPLVIWVYIWIFGKLTGRSTIADLNAGRQEQDKIVDEADSSTNISSQ